MVRSFPTVTTLTISEMELISISLEYRKDTTWTEKFPGHFERPLDSVQLFFRDIGRGDRTSFREQWAVRAYAKFRCKSSPAATETALKYAWRALRYLQPQVAAHLQGNCMLYDARQSAPLES